MHRIKINRLILLLLILISAGRLNAFEKVGVTSFQFLKVMPDARSAAMADATSPLALGIQSVYPGQKRGMPLQPWPCG
jgi:hypothetical protein